MSPVSWGTELDESSGLIDDFDFTITGAGFKYDQKYADGTALFLSLTGRTNDPDQPETEVRLSTGGHWVTKDGGKSIVRDDGKEQMPNKTSMLGKWMNRMVNDFGLLELMESRGHPLSAAPWVGLKLHVKREKAGKEYETLDQAGPKPMPEKFIGVVDGTTGAVAAEAAGVAVPAATPVAAAAPAAGESAADAMARLKAQAASQNGGGGSLRDQAAAILQSAPDFATGQAKCLELEGIAADNDVLQLLLSDGPGSLGRDPPVSTMAALHLVFDVIIIPGPDDNLRELGEEVLVFCADALTEYGVVARKECRVLHEPVLVAELVDVPDDGDVADTGPTEADIILGNAFDGLER